MSIAAYVGLGANLDDPVQQIIDARNALYALPDVSAHRCSSLYISSPLGDQNQHDESQPDFLNCVVELMTDASALTLFAFMQKIEQSLGRVREAGNRNAARRIDCDLLLFGQQKIDEADLVVPHPRLSERLFVLQPLFELAPELQIEPLGKSLAALLEQGVFHQQMMYRLGA